MTAGLKSMSQKKKKTSVSKPSVDYRLSKCRRGPRKNKNNNKGLENYRLK